MFETPVIAVWGVVSLTILLAAWISLTTLIVLAGGVLFGAFISQA